MFIAPFQSPDTFQAVILQNFFHMKKIFLVQNRTVHFSGSVCQIMGFVYQKQVFSFYSLRKKTFQIHIRVEHIIIIADNIIHPEGCVQAHFKGAHLKFLCLVYQNLPCDFIFFLQQIENCVIYPVIVPLCTGTVNRITVHFPAETELFLCGNGEDTPPVTQTFQQPEGLPRHSSGNGFCCEIKNLICQSLSHGFYCRKHRSNSFPCSGGSLDKQYFSAVNGAVYISSQFSLPFPIRKGKFQTGNGSIPFHSGLILKLSPSFISSCQPFKPFQEFF